MAGIGKCIEHDADACKVVFGAKYRACVCTILCEPHGKAVAVGMVSGGFPVDLELDLDLVVGNLERKTSPQPAILRGFVLGQANMAICIDDGVASKVPELILQVGLNVWSVQRV